MSSAPFTTNPLEDQPDSAQAPLFESDSAQALVFENASKAEISDDVEIAIDQLTVVRDVYDDKVLRELAALLPFEVAKDNQAVLLERQKDGSFFVGMCFPQSFVNQRAVARALNISAASVHPRFLNQTRFFRLLEVAYTHSVAYPKTPHDDPAGHSEDQETVNWTIFESDVEARLAREASEPELEIGTGTGLRSIAEKIVKAAIAKRASDIHVVPQLNSGYVKFRTDGAMYKYIDNIPRSRMENLANAFCDMASVNGYEVSQHGIGAEININTRTTSGKKERHTLRFQGMPSLHGRVIVIRINTSVFRDFEQIGLEENQGIQIENSLRHRCGLVLVTGPTGSGKSNTLEAMLREIEVMHQGRVNLIQIGNPIEFPNGDREQLKLKTGDDWAETFDQTLRMDPDIFSPGEFRNSAEAGVVFQAAAAGHLTLTTLHTNNVAQTFSRLDFLGIDRDKQAALLKLIVSQQLIPLLCSRCKLPDPRGHQIAEHLIEVVFPNRRDLKAAISNLADLPFFHATGCFYCNNTGVKGRTCIAEALTVTPEISRMLRTKVDGDDVVKHAIKYDGMITLAEAAARKLCRGLISYDSVFDLLISPITVAPEEQTYAWKAQNESANQPFLDIEPEEVDEEIIDAEIEYTTESSRAAA